MQAHILSVRIELAIGDKRKGNSWPGSRATRFFLYKSRVCNKFSSLLPQLAGCYQQGPRGPEEGGIQGIAVHLEGAAHYQREFG